MPMTMTSLERGHSATATEPALTKLQWTPNLCPRQKRSQDLSQFLNFLDGPKPGPVIMTLGKDGPDFFKQKLMFLVSLISYEK